MAPSKIQPQAVDFIEVVRIATNNNFNCTPEEWEQLSLFAKMYPQKYFFINSNIKTPELQTINDHEYQAVITVNPDLIVDPSLVKKLSTIEPSKVSFVRVKWLPGTPEIQDLIEELSKDIPVMITNQRWNGKASLQKHTALEHYKFNCNRFRLHGKARSTVETYCNGLAAAGRRLYICDRKDLGCGGCGLCAKLTLGKVVKLSSLNLSSSGICPHECPDCYAKSMQKFQSSMGHTPIKYDVIKQNAKQAGRTKHIKKAKAKRRILRLRAC